MENLKGRFVINYKIERGKLYMQYTGQGWWNRSYRINTTMMNSIAAQGWPHIIIWYNADLIMMYGMVLISVTATGMLTKILHGIHRFSLQRTFQMSLKTCFSLLWLQLLQFQLH